MTNANVLKLGIEYDPITLRPIRTKNYFQNSQVGGTSETVYHDEPNNYWVKSRTQIDGTNWAESITYSDGLGRAFKSEKLDSQGSIFTETEFDSVGRPKRSTNPYRANEAKVWTTTNYDSQSRPFEIVTSDGAKVTTAFGLSTTGNAIGTTVTVTDQALKQRRSITNALGQLTRVDEPNDAGQLDVNGVPAQSTNYVYDTLNNLITVNQGVQTRSFAYDSLSRLKSANNPESGIINYVYDNNSNLTSKTDARQITTNYVYDNLNRVMNRNYSDNVTPNVAYTYDNGTNAKGKLTKVNSSVSTTEYTSFDILGRVQNHKQRTDNNDYTTAYTYNLSGALIEETYPSGRVVKNTLDQDGDLQQVQSKKLNDTLKNYANAFTYTSAGAVSSLRLGNGKFENTQFNSRLQPNQIGLGSSATSQNLLKLNFDYGNNDNNGNVKSQTITTPTIGNVAGFTATQNYAYDSLNRLKSAVETIGGNQTWKQTYNFDKYGNRRFDTTNNLTTTLQPGSLPKVVNPEALTSNNRLKPDQDGDNVVDYLYDESGNLTKDALNNRFIYDAENKQNKYFKPTNATNDPDTIYSFDGDGKRVKKELKNGSITIEIIIFVYDANSRMVAEYSTNPTPQNEAQTSYTTNDTLGSPRVITNQNGEVTSRRDFLPYGEDLYTAQRTPQLGYKNDNVKERFTGYARDQESGLEFAQARMYSASLGRFTGSDDFFNATNLQRPQSWNLYVYVENNPLTLVDPSGKSPTDFINIETGDRIKTNDGKDQVIVVDTAAYKELEAKYWSNRDHYNQLLKTFEDSNLNLHMTSAELDNLAGVIYAEASNNAQSGETAAIHGVLRNRAAADGNSILDQANNNEQVFGANEKDKIFDKNASKSKVAAVYIGIAVSLTSGTDFSNGAYFWHGTDFKKPTPGSKAHERFYLSGFEFTSRSHDTWNLGNHNSGNKSYDYKYQSTSAYGQTTFIKLTEAWKKANGANHWDGSTRRK